LSSAAHRPGRPDSLRQMLRQRLAWVPVFINFAIGGALVALLGAVLLGVLVRVGAPPLLAQGVQLAVTLALNFAYNYKITWRDRPRTGVPRQVAWFLATRGATQVVSWFAFAGLISLGLHYQVANAICLAGAMAVNFVTSDKLVFRSGRRPKGRRRAARWPDGVGRRHWRLVTWPAPQLGAGADRQAPRQPAPRLTLTAPVTD
jgi:putative flippase GtrA